MPGDADLGSYMAAVAERLLGEPNHRLSSDTEWRYGSHGSLSVDLRKGTFFDHEAGAGGGVLELIGRETGLKPNGPAMQWLRDQGIVLESGDRAPEPRSRIVATYDYVDESGELVFQVVRFEPKTFRQRRRATDTADGWVWNVKGVRQVPYRLPEILEAIATDKTIYVVEGEKDADNLWKLGVPATTNAMGAGKWPDGLSEFFSGADVVILPDNDKAGQEHARLVGQSLREVAARVRVLDLPSLPAKGDASNWIAAGGTADHLRALVERAARPFGEPVAPPLHFQAVWFADIDRAGEESEWLVDDLLTRGDKSLVYGPSQSGKSFFASHIAMSIALGWEMFGRKVRRGGVVYIAAEGKKGFKKRLRAFRKEFDLAADASVPFLLLPVAVDLYGESDIGPLCEDMRQVVQTLAAMGISLELVVIDTLAAVSPGANENASEDMSRIIRHCEAIQEVTTAHVMIVHHKNAAGDRPRGHTSLYAACDNAIEVTCDEFKSRTAKVAKMKDGEDGERIGFRLQSVEIGSRDDGKPITSCVVVPAQDAPRTSKNPRLSDQQRIALSALHDALIEYGEPAPASLKLPNGIRVVRYKHWRDGFVSRAFPEDVDDATIRKAMQRAGDALMTRRVIGRDQPYVWIVREPSE